MPTRPSRSTARLLASALETSSWAWIISTICQPTLYCGCRLDSGSWKIMPISAPRTRRRSFSLIVSRSRPSNSAVPVISAPRVRPMIVWVLTLLPEPDSPTMPSVWPGSMEKEMPWTARTRPSSVGKETRRSVTSSRLMVPRAAVGARVRRRGGRARPSGGRAGGPRAARPAGSGRKSLAHAGASGAGTRTCGAARAASRHGRGPPPRCGDGPRPACAGGAGGAGRAGVGPPPGGRRPGPSPRTRLQEDVGDVGVVREREVDPVPTRSPW